MRINKYVATHSQLSRRGADEAIENGRVRLNNAIAQLGDTVLPQDNVTLDNIQLKQHTTSTTILFNKPTGYVCSKDGQGNPTVYDIIPRQYSNLNIAGRLDKDSSGLLILSNDGELVQQLTHPSNAKKKIYNALLSKPLSIADQKIIAGRGVNIGDSRPSILKLEPLASNNKSWQITITEGRNRQIRRTFNKLGYGVKKLHRIQVGAHKLNDLQPSEFTKLQIQ